MVVFERAKWIWQENKSNKNTYCEFFSHFEATKGAKINISCDGDYTLFINGKYVASNQYGDYEHYKIYDTIDLTDYIINGENHLAILVWHFGESSSRYVLSTPAVIFEVYNESGTILSSDKNVLSRKSHAYKSGEVKRISAQLGFSFLYDSTKEDNWTLGEGEGLASSIEIEKKCNIFPRPIEKLTVGKLKEGALVKSEGDTHFLYDLGGETVGFISFELEALTEAQINIAYGENLKNGSVRGEIHGRHFSIDYVSRVGKNDFTNYMLRIAGRYLEITSSCKINVNKIGIIPQYVPVKRREPNLFGIERQIYDICVNTLEKCMQEHYVDCPWREGCLYAFDSRNQMLSGYYAFEGGNFEYARSNLLLMSKDRRADGLMSICYPCGIDLTIPSFSLHYISSLLEYLKYSGDKSLVFEVDYKVKEILDTFLKNRENGLVMSFYGENHWNFYDWSPYSEGAIFQKGERVPDTTLSLMTIIALRAYKEICSLCHMEFEYDNDLSELSSKARDTFFDKDKRIFKNPQSENEPLLLTNSLGILADILTKEEKESLSDKLTSGAFVECSLSAKRFVYDALISVDKEKYKKYILNEIKCNYKKMLNYGSDTVWETIDGADAFDGAGSLCHGWSAVPIYYYAQLKDCFDTTAKEV